MIDGNRNGEKLDARLHRGILANNFSRLQCERCNRHNMMTAAQALIAAGIVAAGAGGTVNTGIGHIARVRIGTRYEKHESRDNTECDDA